MKRILALILALCMVSACLMGCSGESTDANTVEASSTPEVQEESSAAADSEAAQEPIVILEMDVEKLYALHDPDEVVATVDGNDVTWGEYFYMIFYNYQSMLSYFSSMASYYGIAIDWNEPIGDGSDDTYASYILTCVEGDLITQNTVRGFANKNSVELSQESLDAIAETLKSNVTSLCGEGATEEDFNNYLATIYMPREVYDNNNRLNYLYQDTFTKLYGNDSALVSDEDAVKYLEENGYMAADHILLMTIDSTTQETLDEATVAEKKAQAEDIAAQLKAIKDTDELLKKFAELKEQYSEDSGAAYYPDGYTFTPGTMVTEFEDACLALGDYEVSDIVESPYGYHIIMSKPLDPDGIIEFTSGGTAMTGRKMAANTAYGLSLDEYAAGVEIIYAEGFERPNMEDYF